MVQVIPDGMVVFPLIWWLIGEIGRVLIEIRCVYIFIIAESRAVL